MAENTTGSNATEVLFYHLERQPLAKVLPSLLEKTVQRGWRAIVKSGSQERLDALDLVLWTYTEDSFLAHGTQKDGFAEQQPIYLTLGDESPNGAKVRFFVDGADFGDLTGLVRAIFMFDGTDDDATAKARLQWKAVKSANYPCTYWQQTPEGRWDKKA